VTLTGDGHAAVAQDYALTGAVSDVTFEFLTDACAEIGRIATTADDHSIAIDPAEKRNGPWTSLQFTGISAARRWRLSYDVTTRGTVAAVPILMPAGPLDTEPGGRGAHVSVDVRWTGPSGGVSILMPRLVPQSTPNAWEATLLAMPSMIRVRVPSTAAAGSCGPDETGNAGGLEWRFAVFVLTMAVWMTAYLAWFGRQWAARS